MSEFTRTPAIAHGLVRTSRISQNTERQHDALIAAGVAPEHIIVERGVGGQAAHREGLEKLLERVRAGDTLLVAELSRLGRRTTEVLELCRELNQRGVTVVCLSPALTFDGSPLSNLLLSLLAAVAEMEVETLRARTIDGLHAARLRGNVGGRRPSLTDAQRAAIAKLAAQGQTAGELAGVFGVSERTVFRALADARRAAVAVR